MKTKIIDEKKNPLFDRKEVILEVESEITPSHAEVGKIISEKFKTSSEAFQIKKIQGNFGSKIFKISANIYPSKEEKENTEAKSKKEKDAGKNIAEEESQEASEDLKKSSEESKKAEEKKVAEEKK